MWLKSFFDPLYRWLTDYMGACGFILYGGGKGDAPAPDPRMGEAALKQIALAEQQYTDYRNQDMPWMRGIAEQALGISRSNAERSGALADYQLASMQRNDDRYWSTAVPFENRLLEDVNRFDSQAYKDQQVGRAMSDVNQAFENVQGQQARGLSRMGVSPADMAKRSASIELGQANALAAAANKTRQAADQIGLSTKMQMYGGMKGLAGLGATNAQLGIASMGAGQGAAAGMTGAAGSYLGANNAAFGASMNGMSQGISGMGQYTQLQQNAANINAQNDPFNTILGAATGVGMNWALKGSDRRLKADIVLVGKDERTGLNLYEFRYINGDKRFRGVMADEVRVLYPEAVFTMPDGYMAVNYSLLGIDMMEVEGEQV